MRTTAEILLALFDLGLYLYIARGLAQIGPASVAGFFLLIVVVVFVYADTRHHFGE